MWLLENQAGDAQSEENKKKSEDSQGGILDLVTNSVPALSEIKRKFSEDSLAICISVTFTLKLFVIDIS